MTNPKPLLLLMLLIGGCTGVPDGLEPVRDFDAQRYLGTWYEIARLDHAFERGLSKVTASYSEREDGGIRVINRGYSAADGEWSEAEGRAYFVEDDSTAHLKVSFFGPFFGSYLIIDLDPDYRHALVAGPDRSYLWLLSRRPNPEPKVIERMVATAKTLGFDTDALIPVAHGPATPPGNDQRPAPAN